MFSIYLSFIVVLLLSFLICYSTRIVRPHKSIIEYLFRGNNVTYSASSNIGSLFSISTFFGSGLFLGYLHGYKAIIYTIVGGIVGLILYRRMLSTTEISSFFYQNNSENKANFSIVDYISHSLGSKVQILFGSVVLLFLACFMILEFGLIRLVIESLLPSSPISPKFLVFLFVTVCLLYILIGGFEGILKTDALQLVIISMFLIVTIVADISSYPTYLNQLVTADWNKPTAVSLLKAVGVTSIPVFVGLSGVDVWIRLAGTLRNSTEAIKSITWSIPPVIIFCSVIIFAGAYIRANNLVPEGNISTLSIFFIGTVFNNLSFWPRVLFISSIIAASLTTVDTFLLTTAQTYHSIIKNLIEKKKVRKMMYLDPRILMMFIAVLTLNLSFLVSLQNFWPYATMVFNLLFFNIVIIFSSIYFKDFFTRYIRLTGLIISIAVTYTILIILSIRFGDFLIKHYDLTPYLDVGSLCIIITLMKFLKKSPILRRTQR